MDDDAIARAEERWLNSLAEADAEVEDEDDNEYDEWVDDQLSMGEDI